MVRGISALQEWVKYNVFGTITLNMTHTPGVNFLTAHKRSMDWTSKIDDYNLLSPAEKSELNMAMEEASGVAILCNWLEVRKFFLKYLMTKVSFLGCKGRAIFHRDEYQPTKGNPPHGHLVWAGEVGDLPGDFFENLIRTHCFDIMRPEEARSLAARGFLKHADEMKDWVGYADTFLSH